MRSLAMLDLTRRDLVLKGSAALAAYAVLHSSRAGAFPSRPGEAVIPWADPPPPRDAPRAAGGGRRPRGRPASADGRPHGRNAARLGGTRLVDHAQRAVLRGHPFR